MKKTFCIFIAIVLCLCMCACGGPEPDSLFEVVARYSDCYVLRNKETNVLYVDYNCSYGMSVLFNADGTPMVWSGR